MRGYLCSYTSRGVQGGNGKGILAIDLDSARGWIKESNVYPGDSPSWLVMTSDGRHGYAVNEVADWNGSGQGGVTAYRVADNGDLLALNTVTSGGVGPAHCSLDPTGRFLLVANYGSGHLCVLPIQPDGVLGKATDIKSPPGESGPPIAPHAPPGSFARSGHDASHAHMIATDPSGRFVLSNDLGTDRTHVWTLSGTGVLQSHNPPVIMAASAGAGPRHFAFHPNGRVLYNLYEETSELAVYAWDPHAGTARYLQCVSTLPEGFAGSTFASALAISDGGRFLYSANRLHNSVAVFEVQADGRVRLLDNEWTRGDYPNHIALDPTGVFLTVCNRRSDQVTVFRANPSTGALGFTGQYFAAGSPNMMVFATR